MVYYSKGIWLLSKSLKKVEIFNDRLASFFSTSILECPLKTLNQFTCIAVAPATCPSKRMQHACSNRMSRKFSFIHGNFHSYTCFIEYLSPNKKDRVCLVPRAGGCGKLCVVDWTVTCPRGVGRTGAFPVG